MSSLRQGQVSPFEPLEPRVLLATFTVTNTDDDGPGSLRNAVALANAAAGADVVEFDQSLEGSVIPMVTEHITIEDELTIRGLGADKLELSGQRYNRVFTIARNAKATIEDLTLKWGQLDTGIGGLIYNDSGASLELRRVTLHDTQALWGAAIYNNFGSVVVSGSTFTEAKAFRHGGAIFSAGGPITVINSTFADNFASLIGGAIYSSNTSTIRGSTFTRNIAREGGGAIFNGAAMTVINSTISGNQADQVGGAIYNWNSLSLEVYNSTIVNNTSPSTGGIANVNVSATVTSTIIAQNSGGDTSGSVISTSNLIGGDPVLAPLADNGGPTQTHALLPGSPAIGNGVNPLGLTTDQRGGAFGRAYNGAVDIGAFQRQPMTQVVDTTSDVDNGNYAPGDLSLREAISRSNSDPEFFPIITFDPSLNDQTITLTGGELQISQSVEIQGPGRNLLRLFANYGSRLLYITADEVSISGIVFDAGSSGAGGAIYAATSRLTLTDVGVLNSQSTGHGGGLYVVSGDVTISDSVFNENTANGASRGGGGIYAQSGTLTINNSQITNNSASFAGGVGSEGAVVMDGSTIDGNTSSGNGGGVEVWNFSQGVASLVVRDSSVTNNTTAANGGGVRAFNGPLTVLSSTVSGNTAGASGGGVHAEGAGAEVIVRATRIVGNSAFEGGGVYVAEGTLFLDQSEVSGNAASENGGGVRVHNATEATIRSSTISGNTAGRAGGGISAQAGPVRIFNSTVARNTANLTFENNARGGGLHVAGGSVQVYSTIFYGNEHRIDDRPWRLFADEIRVDDGGRVSGSHNLVYDESTASGLWGGESTLVGVNPLLAGLADNGGPTRTHAILEGSPAIDAGANPQSLAQDQRRSARVRGNAPDIGAYESEFVGVFPLEVIDGGVAQATSLADGTHLTAARNANGELIVFIESNSAWSVLRMSDQNAAPDVTGDPIIWTDPNDGLAYVAAPSADGLLLFRRGSDGQWSFRDIAGQTGSRADAPTGTLGYFVTRPRTGSPLVYIAGVNSGGEIVAYSQNSASSAGQQASWSFYNISDDLTSQGMSTPSFSKMTTYVTAWNQWTLAGLDSAGNVQGVWVNVATFTTWRVDNLSAITGADPLTGELDVTLTTWGGIRFAGANASGRLVATWWNPSLGPGSWRQTDLSASVPGNEAPALNGGQLTAWFTPTDRISYAGYDNNGDLVSFYWQPGDGASWSSDNLTSSLPNRNQRPVGRVTTHVASDGESNIVGVSSSGDLVRLWALADADPFQLENLSESATRI